MNNKVFNILWENLSNEWGIFLSIAFFIFMLLRQLEKIISNYHSTYHIFKKERITKYGKQIEVINNKRLKKSFIELNDRYIACRFAKTNNYPLALKIISFMNSAQNILSIRDFNYYLKFLEITEDRLSLKTKTWSDKIDYGITYTLFFLMMILTTTCFIIFIAALFLQIQDASIPLSILIIFPVLSIVLLFTAIAMQTGIPRLNRDEVQTMIAEFNNIN